jgi:hypothetical protein
MAATTPCSSDSGARASPFRSESNSDDEDVLVLVCARVTTPCPACRDVEHAAVITSDIIVERDPRDVMAGIV